MRPAVISREAILEASRALLRKRGWSAINMRSVAAGCGVAVGSLYNYFASKNELVTATVESVWKELFQIPEDFGAEEPFCRCVEWLYQSMQRGNERYPGFLTLHAMGFTTDGKTAGRRMMARTQAKLREELCQVLSRDPQVRDGVFDSRLTREGFVELVFSMLLAALLRGEKDCVPLVEVVRRVIY